MAVTIALGIVLAVILLIGISFAVVVAVDWKWWRCWARGHDFQPVEPFDHCTGVLTVRKRHRCSRCGAVPTIADESHMRAATR